jgi:hypothetical protein
VRNKQEQIDFINQCPEHLYTNNPTGIADREKYHFKMKVCIGLTEAYEYALECEKAMQEAEAIARVTGSTGATLRREDNEGNLLGRAEYTRPATHDGLPVIGEDEKYPTLGSAFDRKQWP